MRSASMRMRPDSLMSSPADGIARAVSAAEDMAAPDQRQETEIVKITCRSILIPNSYKRQSNGPEAREGSEGPGAVIICRAKGGCQYAARGIAQSAEWR